MDIIAPAKKWLKFNTKCFLSLEYDYEKKFFTNFYKSFTNLFGKKTIIYHYILIYVGGLINAREPSLLAGFNLLQIL